MTVTTRRAGPLDARPMAELLNEKLTKYQDPENWTGLARKYVEFCAPWRKVAVSDWFNAFIIYVIVLAGILVGLQTYPELDITYDPPTKPAGAPVTAGEARNPLPPLIYSPLRTRGAAAWKLALR